MSGGEAEIQTYIYQMSNSILTQPPLRAMLVIRIHILQSLSAVYSIHVFFFETPSIQEINSSPS